MSKVGRVSPLLLLAVQMCAFGKGVTPYLPLNLEPEMEAQIERVLILGGRTVMTRPIAAAAVIKALPKACKVDAQLCEKVERYLARYMHSRGVTHAGVGVGHGGGKADPLPNSYGMSNKSNWEASAQVYWQPSDYLLVDAGAVGYEGRTNFTGSMISLGGSYAQIDIGFRPHWWSPLSDSSMLMSTEAPATPSVTLSNYEPFTPLGIRYEFFDARMTKSNAITFENLDGTFTEKSGVPKLFGAHLSIEPASGWSLGLSRLLQYGGAGRPQSLKDLAKGFFNPSGSDNATDAASSFNNQFGNQQASITSSFLFPGKVPFVVYAEYAGEDTSHGKNYLLGNSALSVGIHLPKLFERFDLTYETSEWQNAWYTHSVYQDGMSNYGLVTGNWGADQRTFRNDVGAHSNMVRVGWDATFGGLLELRYRTLQNQNYDVYHYDRYRELSLTYSRPYKDMVIGGEFDTGKDSFGGNFNRIQAFLRYDDMRSGAAAAFSGLGEGGLDDDDKGQIFVVAGATHYQMTIDLEDSGRKTDQNGSGYHFAVGARRQVSTHNDLGTRIELENLNGHTVTGVRLVDYRYRFNNPLALEAFFGAARYVVGTPAYGYYYGVGAEWRNILPHTDLGIEARYYDTLARDHLLPTDPQGPRPDSFYYATAGVVSLTYHF
jgi:hypothetical protein